MDFTSHIIIPELLLNQGECDIYSVVQKPEKGNRAVANERTKV